MHRFTVLSMAEKAGSISELQTHVRLPLYVADKDGRPIKIRDYVADYTYIEDGQLVAEDFKSPLTVTPLFKLKADLYSLWYGKQIRISMDGGKVYDSYKDIPQRKRKRQQIRVVKSQNSRPHFL